MNRRWAGRVRIWHLMAAVLVSALAVAFAKNFPAMIAFLAVLACATSVALLASKIVMRACDWMLKSDPRFEGPTKGRWSVPARLGRTFFAGLGYLVLIVAISATFLGVFFSVFFGLARLLGWRLNII